MATGAEDYSNVGEFGINVQVSVEVPEAEGVATAANQATMITALQLIDDLRNALGSVDTDDLQVDIKTAPTLTIQSLGGDKIFSFESIQKETLTDYSLSAGVNTLDSSAVPTGKVWRLELVAAYVGSGTIDRFYVNILDGESIQVLAVDSPTTELYYVWSGAVHMEAGDYLQMWCRDATAGDDMVFVYTVTVMDAP